MNTLLLISRVIDTFTRWLGQAMGWVAVLLVVLGVINVVGRYLGAQLGVQLASNMLLEGQTYAYNLMFLLGASYVLQRDGHIRVDILYSHFSNRLKAWVDIFGAWLFLIPFCILAIYFSINYVGRSWSTLEMSPNPDGLPRYPIKTVIIVCFVLLIFQGVSETIKRVAWLRGVPGVAGPGGADPATSPRPEGV
ncbi:MAG: TRAP transporter small permease subunit [Ectothiorhodospiraceae bacterium]|nr:TRAP transporter small permease subunit [Ectothiorhodospiraceae bacterium]